MVTPSNWIPAEAEGSSSGQTITPGSGARSSPMHSRQNDGSSKENEKCKEGESFMVGVDQREPSGVDC